MDKEKAWKYSPLLVSAILIASVVLVLLFPDFSSTQNDKSVVITIRSWAEPLQNVALASAIFSFCFGIFCLVRKNWLGFIPILLSLAAPVFLAGASFFQGMGSQDIKRIKAEDGTQYALLYESFLQGRSLDLGKVISDSGGQTKYELLVQSSFEDEFGFRDMVRPSNTTDDDLLIMSPDGLLVGFLGSNRAYVAYDTVKDIGYSQFEQYSSHNIKELSPNALLDGNDRGRPEDVKKVSSGANEEQAKP